MRSVLEEFGSALGLDPEDRLGEPMSAEAPRLPIAEGMAAAASAALRRKEPPVPVPGAADAGPRAGVSGPEAVSGARAGAGRIASRWTKPLPVTLPVEFTQTRLFWDARDPTLLMLSGAAVIEVVGEWERTHQDTWLLDTRERAAAFRFFDSTETGEPREFVGVVERGDLKVWPVKAPLSPHLAALEEEVPPLPEVQPPPLKDLLGDFSAEQWLVDLYNVMAASPDLVERLAAVGAVARLWAPAGDANGVFDRLLGGEEGPGTRARRWARALPPDVVEVGTRLAVERALALCERFEALEASGNPEEDRAMAHMLAHERDDLESVRAVLRMRGADAEAEALEAALEAVDREAAMQASFFSFIENLSDDDRLAAAACAEPEAWWGGLAVPLAD